LPRTLVPALGMVDHAMQLELGADN
jgi:hypothetical protein